MSMAFIKIRCKSLLLYTTQVVSKIAGKANYIYYVYSK